LSSAAAYWAWLSSYTDLTTSFGAGTLSTLIVLRWAVGRWENAQKRWWQDWRRVGEGLGRDVRKQLVKTLDEQVFTVPMKACDGLDELVGKRREELGQFDEELDKLERELQANAEEVR